MNGIKGSTGVYVPTLAIPMGDTLREVILSKGLTQAALCKRMRRPEKWLSEIINAKGRLTEEAALELDKELGISALFLLNLQTQYYLLLAKRAPSPNKRNTI